jgi:hypothetical protein
MPLYTYVLTYKGSSYVTQDRRSNFKGFASSWIDLPATALPELSLNLRKELSQKAYSGTFDSVPNRKHVWRKSMEVGGSEFVVYAIQTEA